MSQQKFIEKLKLNCEFKPYVSNETRIYDKSIQEAIINTGKEELRKIMKSTEII